jgi:hypothetical protein
MLGPSPRSKAGREMLALSDLTKFETSHRRECRNGQQQSPCRLEAPTRRHSSSICLTRLAECVASWQIDHHYLQSMQPRVNFAAGLLATLFGSTRPSQSLHVVKRLGALRGHNLTYRQQETCLRQCCRICCAEVRPYLMYYSSLCLALDTLRSLSEYCQTHVVPI